MAMEKGTTRIDWTQEEFDRLAELILDTVSNGGSVMDACIQFEKETNGLRSASSSRFKFNTILSKQYASQYEIAKAKGREASSARAKETINRGRSISLRIATPVRSFNSEDNGPQRMTQRELIRFLRNVELVDDNAAIMQKEIDELKSENDILRAEKKSLEQQLAAVKEEHDQLIAAFNIVRKNVAGISPEVDEPHRYVMRDGALERIK